MVTPSRKLLSIFFAVAMVGCDGRPQENKPPWMQTSTKRCPDIIGEGYAAYRDGKAPAGNVLQVLNQLCGPDGSLR